MYAVKIKFEGEPPIEGLVAFVSRQDAAAAASLAAIGKRRSDGAKPTMVGITQCAS